MPGELPERVSFAEPVSDINAGGGTTNGFVARFEVRAKFRYLRGGETVLAARLEGRQTIVAKVWRSRASEAVTPDWRMQDARLGTLFNVRSIIPTDDGLYLEMTCESGVAA